MVISCPDINDAHPRECGARCCMANHINDDNLAFLVLMALAFLGQLGKEARVHVYYVCYMRDQRPRSSMDSAQRASVNFAVFFIS